MIDKRLDTGLHHPSDEIQGHKPAFAGGVESVASTGGQILSPVMGSGAFLMAAFTETSYISICIAAVIPALLYYWGCGVAVVSQSEMANIELMDPKDRLRGEKCLPVIGQRPRPLLACRKIWLQLVSPPMRSKTAEAGKGRFGIPGTSAPLASGINIECCRHELPIQ